MLSKNNKDPHQPIDVIRIDDIYGIINHIQTSKESCSFIAHPVDSITIENILKDIGITYTKYIEQQGMRFSLSIPPQKTSLEEDISFDEEMDDELPEDGQCF